jgi:hypothetical protein
MINLSVNNKTLALNRLTVIKYLLLCVAEDETFLNKKDSSDKLIDEYESFVKTSLQAHPASSTVQLHD